MFRKRYEATVVHNHRLVHRSWHHTEAGARRALLRIWFEIPDGATTLVLHESKHGATTPIHYLRKAGGL